MHISAGCSLLIRFICRTMAKCKIEWYCFTDNPQWGRYFIGKAQSRGEAIDMGKAANKGKFVVERRYKWK